MLKKPKLSLIEREYIYGWLCEGKSYRDIACLLGRHHTSISREITRNRHQHSGAYVPCRAQAKATKRAKKQRAKAPLKSPDIFLYVRHKLRLGWSPETIAGRLPLDLPGRKICIETIYQYVYASHKHPNEQFFEYLVNHRKKRMKRHGRKVHTSRIPGRIGIEERPVEIQARTTFGHGETDLMEGVRTDTPVVSVTVERTTRYVQLQLLPDKSAHAKQNAIAKDLLALPLKSLTTDNGKENVTHHQWGIPTYFTTPYHSWEKGTVENTIGRLRRYIPKGVSIAKLTQEEVRFIEWEMNNTPRKCLQFQTPAQVLARKCKMPIL